VLIGGPDVREVIRAVKSARASAPALVAEEIVALVSTNTGVPARLVDTAIGYWADYPDEIESWIDEVESFEELPSDRSFVGAIVTAVDDMIVTGQLPADGRETYLRLHQP
jgi:hypothetical protein